jgi:hypothetical protein
MFDHRCDRYRAAGLDVGCDLSELGKSAVRLLHEEVK